MRHVNAGPGANSDYAAGQSRHHTRDRHHHPRYGGPAAQTSFFGAGGRAIQQQRQQRDYYGTSNGINPDDVRWNPGNGPGTVRGQFGNNYGIPNSRWQSRTSRSRSRRRQSRSRSRHRRSRSRSRHRRHHRSSSPIRRSKLELMSKPSINPPTLKVQRAMWAAHDAEIKAAGAFVSDEETELLKSRPTPLKVGEDMTDEHIQFQLQLIAIRSKAARRARPRPPFYGTSIKMLHELSSSVLWPRAHYDWRARGHWFNHGNSLTGRLARPRTPIRHDRSLITSK